MAEGNGNGGGLVGTLVRALAKLMDTAGVTNALLVCLLVGGGFAGVALKDAVLWSRDAVVLPLVKSHLDLVDTLKLNEQQRGEALSQLAEASAELADSAAARGELLQSIEASTGERQEEHEEMAVRLERIESLLVGVSRRVSPDG